MTSEGCPAPQPTTKSRDPRDAALPPRHSSPSFPPPMRTPALPEPWSRTLTGVGGLRRLVWRAISADCPPAPPLCSCDCRRPCPCLSLPSTRAALTLLAPLSPTRGDDADFSRAVLGRALWNSASADQSVSTHTCHAHMRRVKVKSARASTKQVHIVHPTPTSLPPSPCTSCARAPCWATT